MVNAWVFQLAGLWALTLVDETSSFPSRNEIIVTYEDIEALNASCNTLDTCKYDRDFDSLVLYNCNCGDFCITINSCCVDYQHKSQHEISTHEQIKCSEVYGGSQNIFMVSNCKKNWKEDLSTQKLCRSNGEELDDPFLAIPVTSNRSGITYKNYFCAVCNEDIEEKPVFWDLKLSSFSKEVLGSSVPKLHYNSSLDAWVIANGKQNGSRSIVSLGTSAPGSISGLVHLCHKEIVSECAWNWTDLTIAMKCEAYMAIVRFKTDDGLVLYRNPHCAACNFVEFDGMLCRDEEYQLSRAPAISANTFFVGLFSWEDKPNACEENMVYDSLAKKCRKVYKG